MSIGARARLPLNTALRAILLVLLGTAVLATVVVAAPPRPLTVLPEAVIHGGEAGSNLKLAVAGKPFMDVDGDGLRDFLVRYWSRPYSRDLRREHLDLVLGRDAWPTKASVSQLSGRVALVLPAAADAKPGDPKYKVVTNLDVNGDRRDDLVFRKDTFVREALSAVEMRIYLGRAGMPATLDIAATAPDLSIVQPRAPRNSSEEIRVAMPDKLQAGDINGDKETDLIVGTCAVRGPGHRAQSDGALLVWFGPPKSIDLSQPPNATIYSSNEVDVCTANVADIDGDGTSDLLFAGDAPSGGRSHRFGALVYGKSDWAATAEVADLVGARFLPGSASGDLVVGVKDLDGDGKRDVTGQVFVPSGSGWTEDRYCVWSAGRRHAGDLSAENCDLRFPARWPDEAVDLNADKALDYLFPMPQRGGDPFVWRVQMGPLAGNELRIEDKPDNGCHMLEMDLRPGTFSLRYANVAGGKDTDILVFEPDANEGGAGAGRITIDVGPATEKAGVTPPAPGETPEVPTPTSARPTSAPTQPVPTAEPGRTVCSQLTGRVPSAVVAAALADPGSVPGYGLGCSISQPIGYWNPERTYLTLERPNQPYHALANVLTWACGCR